MPLSTPAAIARFREGWASTSTMPAQDRYMERSVLLMTALVPVVGLVVVALLLAYLVPMPLAVVPMVAAAFVGVLVSAVIAVSLFNLCLGMAALLAGSAKSLR